MPLGGRTGQCSVYAEELSAILIYGGFDLRGVNGALLEYKFSRGEWKVYDRENKIFVKVDQMREDTPEGNHVKLLSYACSCVAFYAKTISYRTEIHLHSTSAPRLLFPAAL